MSACSLLSVSNLGIHFPKNFCNCCAHTANRICALVEWVDVLIHGYTYSLEFVGFQVLAKLIQNFGGLLLDDVSGLLDVCPRNFTLCLLV